VYGYLHGVQIGKTDATLFLLSDEAWVHISGYVNSQNTRYGSAGNLMLLINEVSRVKREKTTRYN